LLEHDSLRHGITKDYGILLVGYFTHPYGSPSGMEPHAYLQDLCASAPPCPLPSRQLPLQAQSGRHGALRMVFLRHRSTKDQQDTVASERTEYASIPLCLGVRQLMQRM
jgi:hypothetical protein